MFLGHTLGEEFDIASDLWHWSVERAADTYNRCKIGGDEVTPYKQIKVRYANIPIAAFGEKVLYHFIQKSVRERQTRTEME